MRVIAALSFALALTFLGANDAAASQPNILLIVSDDHGYGDVGAYGCQDIPTPHLDSIAAAGVRFTSGYVSGPYCSPTRAGLLTGRYQQRFGHEFNPGQRGPEGEAIGLPLSQTTLADRLRAAGYVTGMVGKWHLGNEKPFHPMSRGFDEFFGFLGGAHSYVKSQPANPIMRGFEAVEEKEYLTDAFRREALAFIDRHAGEKWFLYLPFNAVHGPMDAAPQYADRFPDLAGGRKTYATMLTAMDEAIGAVLAKLREHGLEENTLILFTADNGGPEGVNSSDNGPLRGAKAQTFEGGVRVPFMAQWKGQLPAGKVYDEPVMQIDFAPTALAAAEVTVGADAAFDGVNLLPFLRDEAKGPPHEALFWRFGQQMAVRKADWKLIKAPGAGLEGAGAALRRGIASDLAGAHLYNLAEDIGETTNVAEQHPDRVAELSQAWEAWNKGNVDPLWIPGNNPARRAQRAQRRAEREAAQRPAP
jgi:arylsulfatase A-like enzyme